MCCPYRHFKSKVEQDSEFDELDSVLYSLERDIIAEDGGEKCKKKKS